MTNKKYKTIDIDELLKPDEDRYAIISDEHDRQAVAIDIIKSLAEIGSVNELTLAQSWNLLEAILRVAQTATF